MTALIADPAHTAFDPEIHDASIASLSTIARIATCAQALAALGG